MSFEKFQRDRIECRRIFETAGVTGAGNDVVLGLCSLLIGPLKIGDRVRIGAGTTVVKNVRSGATVVGSPVRLLTPEVGE